MSTSIEWTNETWNPTTGCDRISPGCDNCYALTMAKRLKLMGQAKYQSDGDERTSGPGFAFTQHADALDLPFHWRKPRKIFVDSMSDLFHKDVDPGFLVGVWETMGQCPQHTFQVLTKRPALMAKFVNRWHDVTGEDFGMHLVRGPEATRQAHPSPKGQLWADYLDMLGEPPAGCAYPTFDWMNGPLRMMPTTPLPNVWLGTSIESDRYAFRADHLRATPAAVRFLSLEPLLGPLPSLDLTGIDWVILGGESGPGARPMHPDWATDIQRRCAAAGVPFLFKQWGAWSPIARTRPDGRYDIFGKGLGVVLDDGRWFDGWDSWKAAATADYTLTRRSPTAMYRLGKHEAGRVLNGSTWDEYPT